MSQPPPQTRRFTLADQLAFARLSGDRNPLHVDPVAARRLLFGSAVVHGVHLALWALDRVVAALPETTALEALQAQFDMPVPIDEEAVLDIVPGAETRASIQVGGRRAARLRLRPGANPPAWQNRGQPADEPCHALETEALAAASGSAPLGFDPSLLNELFPALGRFAGGQIAWILASTRIVGMRVPGLDSVFVSLKAEFAGPAAAALSYRVTRWDERFDLAEIALESGACIGVATAFRRPRPVAQAPLSAVRTRVASGRFAGASVLVIGGSRGLGEAAAKVFAAGGAAVSITYREGRAEAAALVAELAGSGAPAAAIRFDATMPAEHLSPADLAPFTHVVYCAAPRIRKSGAVFDQGAFERYEAIFATGLERTLRSVEPLLATAVTLIVPSSIYVERAEPGFAEYAAAKSAGEKVAAEAAIRLRHGGRSVTLLQPRFDRLRTDQTAAPGGSAAADPIDAFLAALG